MLREHIAMASTRRRPELYRVTSTHPGIGFR
jgi:hypothetical protein